MVFNLSIILFPAQENYYINSQSLKGEEVLKVYKIRSGKKNDSCSIIRKIQSGKK